MFQIHEMTEVHLATFTKREETHGDEKVPAVTIAVELTGANTLLDSIDPKIRHALYMAVEGQEQLPGVEPATPVLRCNSFEKHTLTAAHEGWTLAVDDGIDDTKPMLFGGCKVDRLQVEAKQGGSIVLRFRIGTSDIDAERFGKLGMLHGHSMWITLRAPEKPADVIDGSTEAFERDHPGQGSLLTPEEALATSLVEPGDGDPDEHDGDDGSEGGSPDDAAEFEAGATEAIAKARGGKAAVKYRNPITGDTWSGRGLKPRWLVAELAAGKALGEFVA